MKPDFSKASQRPWRADGEDIFDGTGSYTIGHILTGGIRGQLDSTIAARWDNAALVVYAVNNIEAREATIAAIKSALGTEEDGEALVEVARNAHRAEQELAARRSAMRWEQIDGIPHIDVEMVGRYRIKKLGAKSYRAYLNGKPTAFWGDSIADVQSAVERFCAAKKESEK